MGRRLRRDNRRLLEALVANDFSQAQKTPRLRFNRALSFAMPSVLHGAVVDSILFRYYRYLSGRMEYTEKNYGLRIFY
jgi:hypothetical protein